MSALLPPSSPSSGPEAPPLPPHRTPWAWIAAGLLGVAAAGGIVVAVVSNDGDQRTAVTDRETEPDGAPSTAAPDTAPTTVAAPTTAQPAAASSTAPSTMPSTASPPVVTTTTVALSGPTVPELPGAPSGIPGTRDEPVPVGQIADIGGGWRLQVLEFVADATDRLVTAGNLPPPEGNRFSFVHLALGYYGLAEPGRAPVIHVLGVDGRVLDSGCLDVPDRIGDWDHVFAGGLLVGDLCVEATVDDLAVELLSAVAAAAGADLGEPTVLALGPAPGTITALAGMPGLHAEGSMAEARRSPVPIGSPIDVGDWTLTVTGPATDVTDAALASSASNAPPPDGFRFVGVPVAYGYEGDGSADQPVQVRIGGVGDAGTPFFKDCGDVPGEVAFAAHVPPGGSLSGTYCLVVPVEDLANGTWSLFASSPDGVISILAVR